jgi:hypothetical protein
MFVGSRDALKLVFVLIGGSFRLFQRQIVAETTEAAFFSFSVKFHPISEAGQPSG